jgi:hypothetical protein
MRSKGGFVRYTADELSKLKSEIDWAKVDATTSEEIERQAEADDGPLSEGWEDAVVLGIPRSKRGVLPPPRSRRAGLVQITWPRLSDPRQRRVSGVCSGTEEGATAGVKAPDCRDPRHRVRGK